MEFGRSAEHRRAEVLLTHPFVVLCLIGWLANDHILKQRYHNVANDLLVVTADDVADGPVEITTCVTADIELEGELDRLTTRLQWSLRPTSAQFVALRDLTVGEQLDVNFGTIASFVEPNCFELRVVDADDLSEGQLVLERTAVISRLMNTEPVDVELTITMEPTTQN